MTLLKFRLLQSIRVVQNTGVLLILLALFLLTAPILTGLGNVLPLSRYFAVLAVLVVAIVVDVVRKDKNFLKSILKSQVEYSAFVSIEYLILTLPILVFQAIAQHWLVVGGIVLASCTVSVLSYYLNSPLKSEYKKSIRWIPLSLYELRFKAESTPVMFYFSILLLLLGCVHFSLWVLGLLLFVAVCLESFIPFEPESMLHYRSGFVKNKIGLYFVYTLPLLILTAAVSWFFSELNVLVYIYAISCYIVAIGLAISYKYSFYNGISEELFSKTPMVVMIGFMLVPGFILVSLVYTTYKYFQAESHLKSIYA